MEKPYLNHVILIILGLVVWGSTLATFLIKTYGGLWKKQKRPVFFHVKPKPMGRLTWERDVWKVPKQNAWVKRDSKQNALGLLHLDCRGSPEQRFLKKIEVRNPNENHV